MNNEEISNKIEYLINYYLDFQDYIERFSFPRIDYYYLIKNINKFYEVLEKAKYYLDNNDKEKAFILLPQKIEFTNNIYQNTVTIKYALDYVEKNLEEDKEYEKTEKEEFNK